jgi:hypothetical protein
MQIIFKLMQYYKPNIRKGQLNVNSVESMFPANLLNSILLAPQPASIVVDLLYLLIFWLFCLEFSKQMIKKVLSTVFLKAYL